MTPERRNEILELCDKTDSIFGAFKASCGQLGDLTKAIRILTEEVYDLSNDRYEPDDPTERLP